MRIDFIICGTQKGGTTALHNYLREHPEICMATTKEPHYFDNDVHFQAKHPQHKIYHALFQPRDSRQILGEATPIYMYWSKAMSRIQRYNPRMKLIVLLRDPAKRAYSQWNMESQRGNETRTFSEAIHAEVDELAMTPDKNHRLFSYVSRGYYHRQLTRIWQLFPRTQVLVLRSEALRDNPGATLASVQNFLTVNPMPAIEHRIEHAAKYPKPMSTAERSLMIRIYRQDIEKLEAELDWDCGDWLAA
jgi:hypothetical protein